MRQVPRAGPCRGSGWLGTAVWAQSSLWARPKLSVPFHDIPMPLLPTQLPSLLLCFCPKSPLPKSSCTQFSLSVCFLGNLSLKGSRTLSHSEQLCFDDPDGAMISAEHSYLYFLCPPPDCPLALGRALRQPSLPPQPWVRVPLRPGPS